MAIIESYFWMLQASWKWVNIQKVVQQGILFVNKVLYVLWYKTHIESEDVQSFLQKTSWKIISVIWNAPIDEESAYWEQIDSSDTIIRFNLWTPRENEGKYIWEKTDLLISWPISVVASKSFRESTKDILDIWIAFPKNWSQWEKAFNTFVVKFFLWNRWKNFYFISKDEYEEMVSLVSSETKTFLPSSWFVALYLLLTRNTFKHLHIYWFTFQSLNRYLGEIYTTVHDFPKEWEILRKMISCNSNVTFYW